jgi:flagellar biosynthesis protein FlhF
MPVTASAAALAATVRRFAPFKPVKAILTKLDEAETSGAALGRAILANLPISFVTTGQQAPDDFSPANKDMLLEFLDEPKVNRSVFAA